MTANSGAAAAVWIDLGPGAFNDSGTNVATAIFIYNA